MSYEVRTIDSFEKEFKRLAKKFPSLKSDLLILISELEKNPIHGVALGKGFYKIRLKISSKGVGKSGGARIISFIKIIDRVIYLASIYDKSERSSISEKDLKFLANQIG
ncbi:MAG: type II toxin-antitoxin system RelE/ParE family toxin [Ginsengibacter sp.]